MIRTPSFRLTRCLTPLLALLFLAACEIEISSTTTSGTGAAESVSTATGPAPTSLRVVTYNIQNFNRETTANGERIKNLRKVIADINPTVVGVQEVADRACMEMVFPRDKWNVVIDDDSDDKQDVAFAVRKEWKLVGVAEDLDADDKNFIANGPKHESAFPNRRDGLFITIRQPGGKQEFTLINIHAKARVGGRPQSDARRENSSRQIVKEIRSRFADRQVIVLGDFNDTPDDASLNILETGDLNARGEAENRPDTFLVNLMEPLWAKNLVTHGGNVKRLDKKTGRLNIVYNEARDRNNRTRGREAGSGPALFDHILVTTNVQPMLAKPEATIYTHPQALDGPGFSRPSDHLPVFADINLTAR